MGIAIYAKPLSTVTSAFNMDDPAAPMTAKENQQAVCLRMIGLSYYYDLKQRT